MKKILDIKNLKDTGTEVAGMAAGLSVGYAANKFTPDVSIFTGYKKAAALTGLFVILAPFAPKGFARNAAVSAGAMNALMAISDFASSSTLPGMSALNEVVPQIGSTQDVEYLGMPEIPEVVVDQPSGSDAEFLG